ncbi:hypothetical protein SDRG_16294 [Saprolegnia diclina VS20]|uniref:Transmembrane protein n=1 Tax=Saprolegnia diclina (strain VS20) TaxID=1156394 RepID=T0PXT1_SAPDV|nr:hypothetical protein SDRG_16294 [Saprolegnia diclina VS20]EQC25845.1 hypothetical protein SDRG_16294 [Saprolegnia diclina VS20]|eukprot:XP_008620720.1 hypothetical protein SDRG_16294 [Saprolegnia diclina VS20]
MAPTWLGSAAVVPWEAPPAYVIRFNKRSVLVSLLMVLNVAIMPLKAYISEPLPWTHVPMQGIPDTCYVNFTACSPILLGVLRNRSAHLPHGPAYISNDRFDLVRVALPPMPPPTEANSTFYLDFPYAIFYSVEQRTLLQAVARRDINISEYATTELALFLGVAIAYNAIWLTSTDNGTHYMTVCATRASLASWWQWFKLLYRLAFVVYLLTCMWRLYFKHYLTLVANLRRYGLSLAPTGSTLIIVLGDPTSLILVHPLVIAGFIVDFWMSADFVARAYLRVGQLVALFPFFTACLYLSRTLWFAYGSLTLTSSLLKRCRLAKYFYGVDPTYTAIGVMLAAGPLTNFQTRLPALCALYNILFVALVHQEDAIDTGLAALLYTSLIGVLPLGFGFWPRKRRMPLNAAGVGHNDAKSRWALYFSLCSLRTSSMQLEGGSLYTLFATNPEAKATLGVSQRGSDCYVLFGTTSDQGAKHGVRLSLLSRIDARHAAQLSSRKALGTAVGHLEIESDVTVLTLGANGCQWIR